jgi:hypothetical protein
MDAETQVVVSLTFAEVVTLVEMLTRWDCEAEDSGLQFSDQAEALALSKLTRTLQREVTPIYGVDYADHVQAAWDAVKAGDA